MLDQRARLPHLDLFDKFLDEVSLVGSGNPGLAVLLPLLLWQQRAFARNVGARKIGSDDLVHLHLHLPFDQIGDEQQAGGLVRRVCQHRQRVAATRHAHLRDVELGALEQRALLERDRGVVVPGGDERDFALIQLVDRFVVRPGEDEVVLIVIEPFPDDVPVLDLRRIEFRFARIAVPITQNIDYGGLDEGLSRSALGRSCWDSGRC